MSDRYERDDRLGPLDRRARLGPMRMQDTVRRFLAWTAAMADERQVRSRRCMALVRPPVESLPDDADEPSAPQPAEAAAASNAMQRLIAAADARAVRGARLAETARIDRSAGDLRRAESAARAERPQRQWTAARRDEREAGGTRPPIESTATAAAETAAKPPTALPGTILAFRGIAGMSLPGEQPQAAGEPTTAAQAAGGVQQQAEQFRFEQPPVIWEERASWNEAAAYDAFAGHPSAQPAAGSFYARTAFERTEPGQPEHLDQPRYSWLREQSNRPTGQVMPGAYGQASPALPEHWPRDASEFRAAQGLGLDASMGGAGLAAPVPLRSVGRQALQPMGADFAFDHAPRPLTDLSVLSGVPEFADGIAPSRLADEARLRDMLAEIIRVDALRHGYNLKER